MKTFTQVKSPVRLGGDYLHFGSVYGRYHDVTYNIADFRVYGTHPNTYFKMRVLKRGRWVDSTTLLHRDVGKYVRHMLDKFHLWNSKITPFADHCAAPKVRKIPVENVFRVPHVGYTLSSHVSTDTDAVYPYAGYCVPKHERPRTWVAVHGAYDYDYKTAPRK